MVLFAAQKLVVGFDTVTFKAVVDVKAKLELTPHEKALIDAGEKLEQAMIEKRKMQYLYSGDTYCFMDMETYDQVEIPAERLEWESKFLLEGMTIEIVFYQSEILGINLPEKIALEVTEASPAVAGNTATNAQKEVTLETGLVVKVPMFIEQGEKIIVTTWDGKYSSRA